MSIKLRDAKTIDETSFAYIIEQDVAIPLKSGDIIRCNVYRPKSSSISQRYPVLVTYGPYGKDVRYADFHPKSFSEVDKEHHTEHSAWETPTPSYWTSHGYAIVRADEIGTGQSPGLLDTLSAATIDSFHELIEWASEQSWSTGKIGLLGISYYAGTQWHVAARHPKGLEAIVPWEGFTNLYPSFRHGGILSNEFLKWWWNRQCASNQYGLPGRAARHWGPDTIEGDLTEEELKGNRVVLMDELPHARFRDSKFYTSTNFNLEDITTPMLSVANWGGILLHLRGNVEGYMQASSEFKYLRFIVGRHDLPFYYPEEVEVQRSFLDAFLKGEDRVGWSRKGAVPAVDLVLRKGDVGYNNPVNERKFPRRQENEWPIARTQYTKFYLTPSQELRTTPVDPATPRKIGYKALGTADSQQLISFSTPPFEVETEITGHVVAHLNVSVTPTPGSPAPSDIDLFLSLRHMSSSGKEVFYTGTGGEAVPITKGFLRVSLRKTNPDHPQHRPWLPHRDYYSTDVLPVIPNEIYAVDVEIWPTNAVFEKGERLVLNVSSGDTDGTGWFRHSDQTDRLENTFGGTNFIHFGPRYLNYLTVPIIPPK
ncbi:X-Pro dipeptidyl-peptidase protein [Rhizodiscina lignyota]|uniref:X-Pro dipeptidyl-peptidase protein n=1 Tax=Rhizodiscina lignyota TaxID=1504668 RepID=A0A9P4IJJ6_9PEZI|nr:X-Pro dipeptidyl-peptidase protein [Rhizodiscina lignyota]